MEYQKSTAAELIRSRQKDEYFIDMIKVRLSDILSDIFGNYSTRYNNEINMLSSLLYFIPTILINKQTLGEQYCQIKSINYYDKSNPKILKRFLLIFLSVILPYMFIKFKRIFGSNIFINKSYNIITKIVLHIYNNFNFIWNIIKKIHLCYFYFNNKFYEISKHILGYYYVYYGNKNNNQFGRFTNYNVLGRLLLIQFMISIIIFIVKIFKYFKQKYYNKNNINKVYSLFNLDLLFNTFKDKNTNNSTNNNIESNDDIEIEYIDNIENEANNTDILSKLGYEYISSNNNNTSSSNIIPNCILCLSKRKNPTVTECGHIFCWTCIAEWCNNKPECPVCRGFIQNNKLIRLANMN